MILSLCSGIFCIIGGIILTILGFTSIGLLKEHFSFFYTVNNNEPLFVTVLHKKHPKSFESNFWGALHCERAPFIKFLQKVLQHPLNKFSKQ